MTETEMKWFLLGKLLRRNLMAGVKEATMYSYNGVVLPKLPEWDKTKYPYAVMFFTSNNTGFRMLDFIASSARPFVDGSNLVFEKNALQFYEGLWTTGELFYGKWQGGSEKESFLG